ncbi:abc transporter cdr4 [Fusarium albosuccineum]|uniref:Abc transporter cdr4 n=1 Tax=Fusarium albosuccineum TaxID=1237068 RepID=A0A8H4LCE0_9HYPO|nr:abc transporter cdr4 [Fusarium albosuccineum]
MASHDSEKGSPEPNSLPSHLLLSSSGSHLTVAGEDEPSMALKDLLAATPQPRTLPPSALPSPQNNLAAPWTQVAPASTLGVSEAQPSSGSDSTFSEFAAPFSTQLAVVTKRVVQHYWRSPIYLFSKAAFSSCGTASSPFVLKSYDGS